MKDLVKTFRKLRNEAITGWISSGRPINVITPFKSHLGELDLGAFTDQNRLRQVVLFVIYTKEADKVLEFLRVKRSVF